MHLFIIVVVVIVILVAQFFFWQKNSHAADELATIFPSDANQLEYSDAEDQISTPLHFNETWQEIIKSTNEYLMSTSGRACDFHIVKDIVDRNCQMREEEAESSLQTTLYLGLMGTMIGIIVGFIDLMAKGGANSFENLQPLMIGVALAMVASFFGILFTVISTSKKNTASSQCQSGKNKFLSWFQINVLPYMSGDAASALTLMTENLNNFNSAFSDNIEEMKVSLGTLKSATSDSAALLEAINKMDIRKISRANVDTYEALKGCVAEIGDFANVMAECKAFVQEAQNLNKVTIAQAAEEMRQSCEDLGKAFTNAITEFNVSNVEQIEKLKEVMDAKHNAIYSQLRDTSTAINDSLQITIEELQASCKSKIDAINNAVSTECDTLTNHINNMAHLLANFNPTNDYQRRMDAQLSSISAIIDTLKIMQEQMSYKRAKKAGGDNKKKPGFFSRLFKWGKKRKSTDSAEG